MKILIIEDEVLLADSLRTMLEGKGFSVEAVHDGETGAEYAETGIYDLLILDVQMPRMDGLETLERLLRNELIPPENEDEKKRTLTDLLRRKKEGNDHVE